MKRFRICAVRGRRAAAPYGRRLRLSGRPKTTRYAVHGRSSPARGKSARLSLQGLVPLFPQASPEQGGTAHPTPRRRRRAHRTNTHSGLAARRFGRLVRCLHPLLCNLLPVLLLLLVAAGVFLPAVLSSLGDQRLLGRPVLASAEELPPFEKTSLTHAQKLDLIGRGSIPGQAILMTEQTSGQNAAHSRDDLLPLCVSELNQLQTLGVLPPLQLDTLQLGSESLYTYMDMDQPQNYCLIWTVKLYAEGYSLSLTLDDETGKLYALTLYLSDKLSLPPLSSLLPCWGSYLGLSMEHGYNAYTEGSHATAIYGADGVGVLYSFDVSPYPGRLAITSSYHPLSSSTVWTAG